jgi:hypothetical protein
MDDRIRSLEARLRSGDTSARVPLQRELARAQRPLVDAWAGLPLALGFDLEDPLVFALAGRGSKQDALKQPKKFRKRLLDDAGRVALVEDVLHLDADALVARFPDVKEGVLPLRAVVLLARYGSEKKPIWLTALSPQRRKDPQVVTLHVFAYSGRSEKHRWDGARELWDSRRTGDDAGAPPEEALERFTKLAAKGRHEEALGVFGVALGPHARRLLAGQGYWGNQIEWERQWLAQVPRRLEMVRQGFSGVLRHEATMEARQLPARSKGRAAAVALVEQLERVERKRRRPTARELVEIEASFQVYHAALLERFARHEEHGPDGPCDPRPDWQEMVTDAIRRSAPWKFAALLAGRKTKTNAPLVLFALSQGGGPFSENVGAKLALVQANGEPPSLEVVESGSPARVPVTSWERPR